MEFETVVQSRVYFSQVNEEYVFADDPHLGMEKKIPRSIRILGPFAERPVLDPGKDSYSGGVLTTREVLELLLEGKLSQNDFNRVFIRKILARPDLLPPLLFPPDVGSFSGLIQEMGHNSCIQEITRFAKASRDTLIQQFPDLACYSGKGVREGSFCCRDGNNDLDAVLIFDGRNNAVPLSLQVESSSKLKVVNFFNEVLGLERFVNQLTGGRLPVEVVGLQVTDYDLPVYINPATKQPITIGRGVDFK